MKVMCFVTSDRQGLGAQISDDVYDLFLEQLVYKRRFVWSYIAQEVP